MFILFLFQFIGIQQNYYSNSDSVANITHIELQGDSLYRAWEYVARANYKEQKYELARDILDRELLPNLDKIEFDFYRYSIQALDALIWQNLHELDKAERIYRTLSIPESYYALNYNVYQNWASLDLIRLNHKDRLEHLKLANHYAELANDERAVNKTIRAMARYFVSNKDKAYKILSEHTPIDSVTDYETRAGYLYTEGLILQHQFRYEESMKFLLQASNEASIGRLYGMQKEIAEAHEFSWQNSKKSNIPLYALCLAFVVFVWFITARMTKIPTY